MHGEVRKYEASPSKVGQRWNRTCARCTEARHTGTNSPRMKCHHVLIGCLSVLCMHPSASFRVSAVRDVPGETNEPSLNFVEHPLIASSHTRLAGRQIRMRKQPSSAAPLPSPIKSVWRRSSCCSCQVISDLTTVLTTVYTFLKLPKLDLHLSTCPEVPSLQHLRYPFSLMYSSSSTLMFTFLSHSIHHSRLFRITG